MSVTIQDRGETLRRAHDGRRGEKLRRDTKDALKRQREMNILTVQEHQKANEKRSERNKDKRSEGRTGNRQRTKEMYSIKKRRSIDPNARGGGRLRDYRSVENRETLCWVRPGSRRRSNNKTSRLAYRAASVPKSEMKRAAVDMTNVRSPGGDQVVTEMIKVGGDIIRKKKKKNWGKTFRQK